jgi:hypothetical protein
LGRKTEKGGFCGWEEGVKGFWGEKFSMIKKKEELPEKLTRRETFSEMRTEFRNILKSWKGWFIFLFIVFPLFPKFVFGQSFSSFLPVYFTLLFTMCTVLFGIEWGIVEVYDNWPSIIKEKKLSKQEEQDRIKYWHQHQARRNIYFLLAALFLFLTILSVTKGFTNIVYSFLIYINITTFLILIIVLLTLALLLDRASSLKKPLSSPKRKLQNKRWFMDRAYLGFLRDSSYLALTVLALVLAVNASVYLFESSLYTTANTAKENFSNDLWELRTDYGFRSKDTNLFGFVDEFSCEHNFTYNEIQKTYSSFCRDLSYSADWPQFKKDVFHEFVYFDFTNPLFDSEIKRSKEEGLISQELYEEADTKYEKYKEQLFDKIKESFRYYDSSQQILQRVYLLALLFILSSWVWLFCGIKLREYD